MRAAVKPLAGVKKQETREGTHFTRDPFEFIYFTDIYPLQHSFARSFISHAHDPHAPEIGFRATKVRPIALYK